MENESMFFNEALQENHSNIKEDIKEVEPEFKEQVLKIVGSERLISSPSFLREVHATNRECAERILSEGLKMTRRGGLSKWCGSWVRRRTIEITKRSKIYA